mgnify:CR=1 FL=1
MNVVFKQTDRSDLEELGKILNYYIESTSVNFHLKALNNNELTETLILNDLRFNTFSIFIDGKISGFVQLTQHKKRNAYDCTGEVSIYLEKDFTKKGIGKKALEFIENYGKSKQFHSLIGTICGENIASINLFEKNGYLKCAHYKEVGLKYNHYLDVIALQKLI